MKHEQATTSHEEPPRGARERSGRLRGSRQRSTVGLPELIALAAASLLMVAALASYFLWLAPQRRRLEDLKLERTRLSAQLQEAQTGVRRDADTQASVREIVESLERFELNLGQAGRGSTAVIEELNRLIRANSLRISGGLAFTQLRESAGEEQEQQRRQQGAAERRSAKVVQSVFPGIGISLTVEGSYPNLRRFIRAVESDRQFVVIDAVELEGVTDSGPVRPAGVGGAVAPGSPAPAQPSARGTLVSLRLELAAYFRRAGALAPQAPAESGTR